MYAQSEIIRVAPGRKREALDRLAWMHGLMQASPGFCEALVAKYLGDATRFLVLRYWQEEASQKRFHAKWTSEHAPANPRPPGLFEIEENIAWRCIAERNEPVEGDANFLVKTHRRVPEAVWEEYAAFSAENERAMNFAFGGLAQQRKLRAVESTDLINVFRYASRDDFDRYFESAAHERRTHQWPEGVELVSTQCYEVVAEVSPG
jgi:heme-degrading monooxygenase HmoA